MRHLTLFCILAFVSVTLGLDIFSTPKSRRRRALNLRTLYQSALRKGEDIYNARRSQVPAPVVREDSLPPTTYDAFYEQQADQYENQVPSRPYDNQVERPQISSETYQQPLGPGNVKWNVVRNGNSVAYSYVFNNRPARPVVQEGRIAGTGGINTKYNSNVAAGNPTLIRTGGIRPVLNPNNGVRIPDPRVSVRVNTGFSGPRVIITGPSIPRINNPNTQFSGPIPINNGPIDPRINGGNPVIGGPINPRINNIGPVVGGPIIRQPNGLKPTNNVPIDPRINGPVRVNPGFINIPTNTLGPSKPISPPTNPGIPISGGPLLNPGFGNPRINQEPVALGLSQGPEVDPVPDNSNDPLVFTRQADQWFWGGDWVSGPLRGAVPAKSEN